VTNRPPWLTCENSHEIVSDLGPLLIDAAAAENPSMTPITRHLVGGEGKLLRPALTTLSGQFGRANNTTLQRAAVAVELLHVGSLYHDDVMDRASMRRGLEAANRKWDVESAALAGTFLFARAVELLNDVGGSVNSTATSFMAEVCAGQLRELTSAYDSRITADEHLAIISAKTGALFELACRVGALVGEASGPIEEAVGVYGRSLGIAFQLTDDVLDLTANSEWIGKGAATDIREGIYTLPVVFALQGREGDELRKTLTRAELDEAALAWVLDVVRKSGGVEETLRVARHHAETAQMALKQLPDLPARNSMSMLAQSVAERTRLPANE
jgi:heptaprenyl diphosphate synthase